MNQLYETSDYRLGDHLEFAEQSDYADAASFDLGYQRIELRLDMDGIDLSAGQETLEGNGKQCFATPLATVHAFNGCTDQFLKTPASGLKDRFVGVSTELGVSKLQFIYHDLEADQVGQDHGSEWNASAGFSPAPGWSLLVKYADYSAEATSVDTEKLWLQAAYRFQ